MTTPFSGFALRCIALAVACFLLGCGGSSTVPQLGSDPAGLGQAGLPSVAELAARGASFTEASLMRTGSAFEGGLSSNNVNAVGSTAVFAPLGNIDSGAGNLAFAVYGFGVEDYDRDLNVRLTWSDAPASGQGWLALANFTLGRWQWFEIPAGHVVEFTGLADYTGPAPDHLLYAAVLVGGSGSATLDQLRVGTQPSGGVPLTILTADTLTGFAPLTVNFEATGIPNPPATIVGYEFDAGEGAGYVDNGDSGLFTYEYTTPGDYTVLARATDIFGGQGTASVQVSVTANNYDEVENNDDPGAGEMNELPAMPFAGFTASMGTGAGYPGYDGDDLDYFSFTGNPGEVLQIKVDFASPDSKIEIMIGDSNFNLLDDALAGAGEPGYVNLTVDAGHLQPYILQVFSTGNFGDYSISGQINAPIADLTATPAFGPTPLNVILNASGSSDTPPGSIVSYEFDPEGDGTYGVPQAGPMIVYNYTVDGNYRAAVRVTDDDGLQSEAFVTVLAGTEYDELENNDSIAEANALTLPTVGFRGSHGTSVSYPGYDGDEDDYYSFTASPGDVVRIDLRYDGASGDMSIELGDSADVWFDWDDGANGQASLTYTVDGTETMPIIIDIHDFGGPFTGDYEFDVLLNPPTAVLSATPSTGDAPLDVVLDASGSADLAGGSIVSFEFDPLGDGTWSAPSMVSVLPVQYTSDGIYVARVRVTDDEGNASIATATVGVGINYDEVEDNDDFPIAQVLPAFPLAGFAGSAGSRGDYPGYDGDEFDYFQFNAVAGQTLDVTLTFANGDTDLDLYVLNEDFSVFEASEGLTTTEQISYTFQPGDIGPYYIVVSAFEGGDDYTLDATLN